MDYSRNRTPPLLNKRIFDLMYEYILTGRSQVDRPRKIWTDQILWRWSEPRNGLYPVAADDEFKRFWEEVAVVYYSTRYVLSL